MTNPRGILLDLLASRAYGYDPEKGFPLASGDRSSEYIDCKEALSLPEGIAAASALLVDRLIASVEAVGGLTMGADPLAIAVSMASAGTSQPRRWFSVRKQPKSHGRKRLVEGLPQGSSFRLAIFDDVATRGESTLDAIRKARSEGHHVVQVVVLVDREAGGLERIQQEVGPTVPVSAIFRLSEIHQAWQRLNPGSTAPRLAI